MQCPCQQNFFVFIITSDKEKLVLKYHVFKSLDFYFDTYLYSFLTDFQARW